MNDASTTVVELRKLVKVFVAERQWEIYHDAKNLSMALSIEAAELMEHFQWARNEELVALLADERKRNEIGEEIADVACFLLALCNSLDLDLSDALTRKMEKNRAKYPADTFRGQYFKPPRAT